MDSVGGAVLSQSHYQVRQHILHHFEIYFTGPGGVSRNIPAEATRIILHSTPAVGILHQIHSTDAYGQTPMDMLAPTLAHELVLLGVLPAHVYIIPKRHLVALEHSNQ